MSNDKQAAKRAKRRRKMLRKARANRPKKLLRKKARKTAQHKDYVRRRNINSNVPTLKTLEKKEVFRTVFPSIDRKGRPNIEHAGYKNVVVKTKQYLHRDKRFVGRPAVDEYNREVGMIAYPKKRKFTTAVTK